jgi:hypothetical protein
MLRIFGQYDDIALMGFGKTGDPVKDSCHKFSSGDTTGDGAFVPVAASDGKPEFHLHNQSPLDGKRRASRLISARIQVKACRRPCSRLPAIPRD